MAGQPKKVVDFKETGLVAKCVAGWKGIADDSQDTCVHHTEVLKVSLVRILQIS